MNEYLIRYIRNQIEQAADFVCGHMPVALSSAEVYEDLFSGIVDGEDILHDFRMASRHLVPSSFLKRLPVRYARMHGRALSFTLRLEACKAYNTYLVPAEGFAISPESKLAQALRLPLLVAQQWAMLQEAFDQLAAVTDTQQIAMLMPWLREMVDQKTPIAIGGLKRETTKIIKDVKLITQGNVPNRFPRLTGELNQVCLSGKMLFTQHRLLETTSGGRPEAPPIAITRTNSLLPEWFNQHLKEVIGDWM